jgi:hypothetical protein
MGLDPALMAPAGQNLDIVQAKDDAVDSTFTQ